MFPAQGEWSLSVEQVFWRVLFGIRVLAKRGKGVVVLVHWNGRGIEFVIGRCVRMNGIVLRFDTIGNVKSINRSVMNDWSGY